MVCVDTSVWIAAFRSPLEPPARHLRQLLDRDEVLLPLPVRFELLAGAGRNDQARLSSDLSALPLAVPNEGTWDRIEEWLRLAVEAGERFGFADLLIASLAVDHGTALWSFDRDFVRMAQLQFIAVVG